MTASVTDFIQSLASTLDTMLPSVWTSSQPQLVGLHQQNVISLKQLNCLILPFFPLFFTFFKTVS